MDTEALHIHELVVEAGALLEWVQSGTLPGEAVWMTLDRLRSTLTAMADHTNDADAVEAAFAMVADIESLLAITPAPSLRTRGAA